MLHVRTLGERFFSGEIQPPNFLGILKYMGLAPDVVGDVANGPSWREEQDQPSGASSNSIPINGKFGDDFVTHLVVITPDDTMAEVAKKVARHSVGKRIPPEDRDMIVYYESRPVASDATVRQLRIAPLQHLFVDYAHD
jgi:toluene monooxygenase system protein B